MICPSCLVDKPTDQFSRNTWACKACARSYKYKRRYTPICLEDFEQAADRFWAKVHIPGTNPNVCWEWTGGMLRNGYGCFNIKYRIMQASKVAYILTHKTIPPRHLFTCHSCDNPPCCNPHHLFLGTGRVNSHDASAKGRIPHKLSDADVLFIDSMRGTMSAKSLANHFNITWRTVYAIWYRERRQRILPLTGSALPRLTQTCRDVSCDTT